VTTFALQDTRQLLDELDERVRGAWSRYSSDLRDLVGADYEDSERSSWAELQATLREIEAVRATI
jgi:hypothetical protein